MEACKFFLAQAVEADTRLLAPGVIGDGPGAGGLAGKIGMTAQELYLTFSRCPPHRTDHGLVQRGYRRERPPRRRAFGHPGRQLKSIADGGGKFRRAHQVQRVEAKRHAAT